MDGNGGAPTTPGGSPVARIGDCLTVRCVGSIAPEVCRADICFSGLPCSSIGACRSNAVRYTPEMYIHFEASCARLWLALLCRAGSAAPNRVGLPRAIPRQMRHCRVCGVLLLLGHVYRGGCGVGRRHRSDTRAYHAAFASHSWGVCKVFAHDSSPLPSPLMKPWPLYESKIFHVRLESSCRRTEYRRKGSNLGADFHGGSRTTTPLGGETRV